MKYPSVDKIQKTLAEEVFHYAKDSKKASGRALGTLIEIIAFYLIKDWGLESNTRIEKSLEEYSNRIISHNVEYTLHPTSKKFVFEIKRDLPIATKKIFNSVKKNENFIKNGWANYDLKNNTLLSTSCTLRNSCVFATSFGHTLVAVLKKDNGNTVEIELTQQLEKPFAMVECKRVGVEEGMKKGPQTIEKAKQGAYVARTVSSMQKIRDKNGELCGAVPLDGGGFRFGKFEELLMELINSEDKEVYKDFILTIGFVSNHGNWFTSDNPNKELRVLSDAYDWLLFLTDKGLAVFIEELLSNPSKKYIPVKDAFLKSYDSNKGIKQRYGKNQFTKVQMNEDADVLLQDYFRDNRAKIKDWINVISPKNFDIEILHSQLEALKKKER